MADRYFSKFPTINYANTVAVDITRRATILNSVYGDPNLYYLYDIEQYERPDNLSERYYEDPYRAWMLYLNNRVIDPYYDWYMDTDTFNDFIAKKYGSVEKAMSTIKFYRNNWYSDTDMITVSTYQSLTAASKRYYDPVYDTEYSPRPMGYTRKRDDRTSSTNATIAYNVANGSSFSTNDRVKVYLNTTELGAGQVLSSNSTVVVLQHVSGTTSVNSTPTWKLLNTTASSNTTTTSSTTLSVNISTEEVAFWEPVYIYDYELELNEKNKSIRVLNSTYSDQLSKNLEDIL